MIDLKEIPAKKNGIVNRYENYITSFVSGLTPKNIPNSKSLRISSTLEYISYLCGLFVVLSFITTYRQYNGVLYTIETDYRKWVTTLPSYTVCPMINRPYVSKQINRITNTNDTLLLDFIVNLMNASDHYCASCSSSRSSIFPEKNYREIVREILQPCEALLVNCLWNGKTFQCCQHFHQITTKQGICFSLNSAHSHDPDSVPASMVINHRQPDANLELELNAPAKIYVHDKRDLTFYKYKEREVEVVSPGQKGLILYKFVEVIEDSSSWLLTPNQRNCSLSGEFQIEGYKVYSRSVCRIDCLVKKQKKICGCKHHLLSEKDPENDCDLQGLKCLEDNFKTKKYRRKFKCKCLRDCSYTEVGFVEYSVKKFQGKSAMVLVKLASPPTERVKMEAKITTIDVIVAFACVSRLITRATFDEMILRLYWATKEFIMLISAIFKSFSRKFDIDKKQLKGKSTRKIQYTD